MLVEAIPIIFVIVGFILIAPLEGALEMVEILPALVLVILILAVGLINVFMRLRETLAIGNISNEAKAAILTTTLIGVSLISAIPIVSIVAILIMLA
ncbi:hypothetical protein BKP35_05370 [Anaerobacillus arseniciselenatis]|uniref:Uncharacterized protein n=1 Tax=Anaerobacillus arseniciselenatis TaxID=85682 RepID=A0A1S2LRY8_9BACI|nr:hypothetical protein [Anaerobacillus arseniciselenatis]OIJ15278.1 hypothetical protein BKP35_05370 [Anaerobacillus arseniciselenatis]